MKKISIVSLIVIIVDRIIKILIEKFLRFGVRNTVINNFFYLTFCKNEGAAFSILNGKTLLLVLIGSISIYLLYNFIKREKNLSKLNIISYGLLMGGVIGNLIDRLLYGYVIDYLDFQFLNLKFAIFNFADMAIVIGVFMILLLEGSDKDENKS